MQRRTEEIEQLAEGIASFYVDSTGRVALEQVAAEQLPPLRISHESFPDPLDGCIHFVGGEFFIIVNTSRYAPGDPRARFTLAHEFGHYFIDEHRRRLMSGDAHYSRSHFRSTSAAEGEADLFAAALLMPSERVSALLPDKAPGFDNVFAVGRELGTSATSTAIRTVKVSDYACAVACSDGKRLVWFFSSESWNEIAGSHPRRGDAVFVVPSASHGQIEERQVTLGDWCPRSQAPRLPVWEETIDVPVAGRCLTFLSIDEKDVERHGLLEGY